MQYVNAAEDLYLATQRRRAVAEARGWLLDCFPDDEQDIRLLNAVGVVAAVSRHYEGGWRGFLADAGLLKGA